jgi:glycosyltransferase involved in cell wall biosynthesis
VTAPPRLSVVVPAHDEAPSLLQLAHRVRDVLDREGWSFELIVIDDGSRDGTDEVLADLEAEDRRFIGISMPRRRGKSAALACGFARARGTIVVTMDADLQDLPEEIPRLVGAMEQRGLDVAQAWRTEREDHPAKVFASWGFNLLCSTFSGLRMRDVNCGFKAIRRDALQRLELDDDLHRFIPVLLHRQGCAVGEVPVKHARRAFGHSRYGPLRYVRGLTDLVTVVLLPRVRGDGRGRR